MRVVAVDIGNTRGHIGVFDCDGDARPVLRTTLAISHAMLASARLFTDSALKDGVVAYASVAPAMEERFVHAVFKATGRRPLRLGRDFPPAIRNRYRPPQAAGLDRLANAAAAWARTRGPCVAVDLGTAITFDVVNRRGEFVGGLIAPGLRLQARALHQHTALLPEVAPRRVKRPVGRTTAAAISSGIAAGVEGLIRAGLAGVRRELGGRVRALATGGDAPLYRELFDEVVPELTVEGVAISYARA